MKCIGMVLGGGKVSARFQSAPSAGSRFPAGFLASSKLHSTVYWFICGVDRAVRMQQLLFDSKMLLVLCLLGCLLDQV
jgi:hypothetical protein